ncbi:MAG TPA: NAD(P)H-dependent glycerol-3-phosphate dehydrogenase [Usitatibacteraceae bacterium]|nr:NAD(P)H-dependent glycerol-3-phosphate dehydrogenase [Usitatibacteraceae bacterium]
MKIAVIGAGAWGTALAISFSPFHPVCLWARDGSLRAALRQQRTNQRYLPGAQLPDALQIGEELQASVAGADIILIATPTSGLAEIAGRVRDSGVPILWACKGFDKATGKLPHETVAELVSADTRYGALSGPSFAIEVARGLPCALTLAANDPEFAAATAAALSGPALRIYSSADLVGVELGGALKNVMAIAAGICDGMSLGMNARAALITRGLAEMVRLGVAMGGRAETFMGLTGLGDLVLTATGDLSRNRMVGMRLAEGRKLADVLSELGHVAEGVNSAATALVRARETGVEMPITEAVNAILFDGAEPRAALKQLLSRETKPEHA